jgi:KDO2-lipid IV(A) lauroyltransferase
VGPALLARKTGAPLLPAFVRRLPEDPTHHVLQCHPAILPDPALDEATDLLRMTQAFTDLLEAEIRADPGQWMWMHERWKHRPKGGKEGKRKRDDG